MANNNRTNIIDPDIDGEFFGEESPVINATDDFIDSDELNESSYVEYFAEAFNNDETTQWKKEDVPLSVEADGVNKDLISSVRRIITPTSTTCERLINMESTTNNTEFNVAKFANIYFNRQFYIFIQDYLKARIMNVDLYPSFSEIMEMIKVWLCQFIYGITSNELFDSPDWYPQVSHIGISKQRYNFLFKKMGNGEVELDIFEHDSNTENTAEKIWGHFDKYNGTLFDLENLISKTGRNFCYDGAFTATIDDDKLRHSSKRFRDEGLQMTGFRGSRIGPVMNGMGLVESGVIVAVRFSRHGDSALSVTKNLFKSIGYGNEPGLQKNLGGVTMIDRGYHIPCVIKYILSMGLNFLGTHSEKTGSWPFATGSCEQKAGQHLIPIDGARAAFIQTRKLLGISVYALCYRSGSKGIGNIHTNLHSDAHAWTLSGYISTSVPSSPPTNVIEEMYSRWMNLTYHITSVQATTPWFESRMGRLTGTTAKNVIRCLKFEYLDISEDGEKYKTVMNIFGLKLERYTIDKFDSMSVKKKKTECKRLGFHSTSNMRTDELSNILLKQYPHKSLVLEKIFKAWCMAPIKRKGNSTRDSFRQGRMAEPLIHESISTFLDSKTSGSIIISLMKEVGLIRSIDHSIAAVSPDGIAVITCSIDESINESVRLSNLLNRSDHSLVNKEDQYISFVCAMEYKHKSSIKTVATTQQIVSQVLMNKLVQIIDLDNDEDVKLFHKAVPEPDYRMQIIHELVCTNSAALCFVVATTKIEFCLICLAPTSICEAYSNMLEHIRSKYLSWMFIPGTNNFDKELSNFPKNDVKYISNWGYAVDVDTVCVRLQLMMGLDDLRQRLDTPLTKCNSLLPKPVSMWNKMKGPIDDLSKVLAHNLGKFGPISPMCVIWIRAVSTMLYNIWRLHALYSLREKISEIHTFEKYQVERKKIGLSFKNFLKDLFTNINLPSSLPLNELVEQSNNLTNTPSLMTAGQVKVPSYSMPRKKWRENEWVNYRLDQSLNHIPVDIETLQESRKRKRDSPNKRKPHRDCKFCTVAIRNNEKSPTKINIFDDAPKQCTKECLACKVTLCTNYEPYKRGRYSKFTCFELFHKCKDLPELKDGGE